VRRKWCSLFKKILFGTLILGILPFFFLEGAFIYSWKSTPSPTFSSAQGIIVYVINLDRSPHRWASILPQVQQLDFPMKRIAAIDGRLLPETEIDKLMDKSSFLAFQGRPFHKGEVGAALSHVKAWKMLLDSPYAYALVFEDDVIFDPKRVQRLASLLAETPNDWDMAVFKTDKRSGSPLTLRSLGGEDKLVIHLRTTWGLCGYLINRKAAAVLAENAFPMKLDIDLYSKRFWESGLKIVSIEPKFFAEDNFPTDIGEKAKAPPNFFLALKRNIQYHVARMKTRIVRVVYGLVLYFQLREK
jgi:glycosyl transferase family 25